MSDFEKFKEEFYSVLTDRKINEKEYEYVLNFSKKIDLKTMNDYHNLY